MSLQYGAWTYGLGKGWLSRNQVDRNQVELNESESSRAHVMAIWGLDVRTRQGLASRDEAGCSGRCPAALPTGKVGWFVLRSTARVSGLEYHAGGPGGRTDITELIVGSIESATGPAMLEDLPGW